MTSPGKAKPWAGRTVTKARAHWAKRLPQPCHLCGQPVTSAHRWVVEHLVPRHLGGSDRISNQGVSHRRCSDKSGSQVRTIGKAQPRTNYTPPMAPASARGLRGI